MVSGVQPHGHSHIKLSYTCPYAFVCVQLDTGLVSGVVPHGHTVYIRPYRHSDTHSHTHAYLYDAFLTLPSANFPPSRNRVKPTAAAPCLSHPKVSDLMAPVASVHPI